MTTVQWTLPWNMSLISPSWIINLKTGKHQIFHLEMLHNLLAGFWARHVHGWLWRQAAGKTNEIKSEDSAASLNTWTHARANEHMNKSAARINWNVVFQRQMPDFGLNAGLARNSGATFMCTRPCSDVKYGSNSKSHFLQQWTSESKVWEKYIYLFLCVSTYLTCQMKSIIRSDSQQNAIRSTKKHRYIQICHPNKTEFWHFCKILQKKTNFEIVCLLNPYFSVNLFWIFMRKETNKIHLQINVRTLALKFGEGERNLAQKSDPVLNCLPYTIYFYVSLEVVCLAPE